MNLRNGLLAGGVALLAVVAAVGWTRKAPTQSQPVQIAQTAQPAGYDAYGQPVNGQPANGQPVYSTVPASQTASVPCTDYNTADRQAYYGSDERYYAGSRRPVRVVHQYVSAPAPVVERERVYYTDRRGHRRSTGKSVAIVAGSAAGGAAIGALAGGGKGAGIGALAGGGAGFIYDRLTHNHVH
jgi:hypothetical protein